MKGFIPRILEDAVEYCCSDCLLPNGKSASIINFEIDGNGNPAQKSDAEALLRSIDNQTDFSAPVNVHRGQVLYSLYPHVELAESSGVAFIAAVDRKVKSIAVQNLFFETWPLLLLTSIMMLAVGMIMWILVCPIGHFCVSSCLCFRVKLFICNCVGPTSSFSSKSGTYFHLKGYICKSA